MFVVVPKAPTRSRPLEVVPIWYRGPRKVVGEVRPVHEDGPNKIMFRQFVVKADRHAVREFSSMWVEETPGGNACRLLTVHTVEKSHE
jgi:hypothetical protein